MTATLTTIHPHTDKDQTTVFTNAILGQLNPDHLPVRDPKITLDEYDGEDWTPMPGYPAYEFSTLGRYALAGYTGDKGQWVPRVHLSQNYAGRTPIYARVRLVGDNRQPAELYTHVAVYRAFHGFIPEGYQVDHVNGNTFDNRLDNLRLTTAKGNNAAAVRRRRREGVRKIQWMEIADAINGPYEITDDSVCSRGHTAEQFGTRKDKKCRACTSQSHSISYKVLRASMNPWIDQWREAMTYDAEADGIGEIDMPMVA